MDTRAIQGSHGRSDWHGTQVQAATVQVCLMARTSQRPAGAMQPVRLWTLLLLLLLLGALVGELTERRIQARYTARHSKFDAGSRSSSAAVEQCFTASA